MKKHDNQRRASKTPGVKETPLAQNRPWENRGWSTTSWEPGALFNRSLFRADKVRTERRALTWKYPFFGTLATRLNLEAVSDGSVETYSTDGYSFKYNSDFVKTQIPSEIQHALIHNVMHCALQHPQRMLGKDPKIGNLAADIAVAATLHTVDDLQDQFTKFSHDRFGGMTFEGIYARLIHDDGARKNAENAQNSNPHWEDGGDVQPPENAGEPGETANSRNEWTEAMRQAAKKAVGEAAMRPKRSGEKTHGTGMMDLIEELVGDIFAPTMDWRRILQDFVGGETRMDYSWTSPSRRSRHPVIMPGIIKDGVNNLVFAIDTSSSMDEGALQQGLAELQAALDTMMCDKITVIQCNNQLQLVKEYAPGDSIDLKIKGRGGTSFRPVFRYISGNIPQDQLSGIIYFTDMGCGGDWAHKADYPTVPMLWLIEPNIPEEKYLQYFENSHHGPPFGKFAFMGTTTEYT